MKFTHRRAISPIIAVLLLIAITVAAGIIVYVFVNSLAGGLTQGGGAQTTERLQLQSYNFALNPGSCACAQQIVQLFLLNSGSATSTISAVYFDGALMTLTSPSTTQAAIVNNAAYTAAASALVNDESTTGCTAGTSTAGDICFTTSTAQTSFTVGATGQVVVTFTSAQTAGTSHTVKVVSATGATYVFSVIAGRTG